jgi:hypothetical protein
MYDPGFPAADVEVRDFFAVDGTERDTIVRRSHAFLIALFTITRDYLQNIDQHITQACELPVEQYPQTIAQKFRLLMTAGQTFMRQGEKRSEFYSAVMKYANEVIFMSCITPFLLLTSSYQLLQPAISSPPDSSTRPVTPPAPHDKSKRSQQPDSPSKKMPFTRDGGFFHYRLCLETDI